LFFYRLCLEPVWKARSPEDRSYTVALDHILQRIKSKKIDYTRYDFTKTENNALTAFFDLAQEFYTLEDLYDLCVAIPKCFFSIEARLYVIDPKGNVLSLVSQTREPGLNLHSPPPSGVQPREHTYYTEKDSLILTIRGKEFLIDQLPFKTMNNVLGLLEVYPCKDRNPHRELFFEKYANRIGFNIHNQFLVQKNIEHLKFIRALVADIEHNVIVPNMAYRLFLHDLKNKIAKNKEIEKLLSQHLFKGYCDEFYIERLLSELVDVNRGLTEQFEQIEKHYINMSLFLETLLRRSHFDLGHLTLRTKRCNMLKDVVRPQLERFIDRFRQHGISIDHHLSGIPDEETISVVDVGLMAQVYANLFSNALKYTEEVTPFSGEKLKYASYGHEIIKNFFGDGKDGIKYNVFSTGPHINSGEREKIFNEEYRGSNAADKPGTGHGLAFIKSAIEIHGGVVGYEPTRYGNNFYFILPI
jgi:signal transduction histidine kinase